MKTGLLFASVVILLAGRAGAGDPGIAIAPATGPLLESRPREIVTCAFLVANWGEDDLELATSVELPPGWHLLTSDGMLSLKAGRRETSIVSFLVPRTARAGSYTVGFSVRHTETGQNAGSSVLQVDVVPVSELRLQVVSSPGFVVAGNPYQVSLALTNLGNSTAEVEIQAASRTGYAPAPRTGTRELEPGESSAWVIEARTDPDIRETVKERLSVAARTVKGPPAKAQVSSYVDILPRVTGSANRFRKLPVSASIAYFNERNGNGCSGVQTSLVGSGDLDEDGGHHVKFVLRGPHSGLSRLLPEREEYFVDYAAGGRSVILGDYGYSVSPLTRSHIPGRGGRTSFSLGHLGIGAHHMKSRWAEPQEEETAAYVDYGIGAGSMVGIRYLRRELNHPGEIVSFESRLCPAQGTDLQTEYARQLTTGVGCDAWRLKFTTLAPWGSYLLRFINAGPCYQGYYRNMDYISTSLGLNVSRVFRFDTGFRQERHYQDPEPPADSNPLQRDYSVRLLFRAGPSVDYSLALHFRQDLDQTPQAGFDFLERSVRAAFSRRYLRWDWSTAAEIGRTRDRVSGDTKRVERYTAAIRIKPTGRQFCRAFFSYDLNGRPDSPVKTHLSGGVIASFEITSRTAVQIGARSNLWEDLESRSRSVVEINLRQGLFRGTEMRLNCYYSKDDGGPGAHGPAFMLEYDIPFGLPVGKRNEAGTLKGRVYDEDTGSALEEVLLTLDGATAVTDGSGRFVFPAVHPGTHHLRVDKSSIGLDRITRESLPVQVEIHGGKTATVDMPVVKAASLSGRVEIFTYGDATSAPVKPGASRDLKEAGGLANILVQMSNGEETRHFLTSGDGTFAAADLRPGVWTITIPPDCLPSHHVVADDSPTLDMRPGSSEAIAIRIIPVERPVRMLKEGGTIREEIRD
jgi:hypothetical protein